jgi:hypothetical protein
LRLIPGVGFVMNAPFVSHRSRRGFLAGMIGLLASCIPVARSRDPGLDSLQAWLRRLAADVPGAASLGSRYLEQRPAEASAAWLARELFGTELGDRGRELDRLIAYEIGIGRESDYRNGNLVVLGGWFVTQTEARLMALVSLRTS